MFSNREIDLIKAALRTSNPSTSNEMQEVNVILGKLESMRIVERVEANGNGSAAESQTV